ncbi:glycosyltransferase family 2 protein [Leeuwenhoekiella marinoflava]|uniref:Glycosyltransferase involved in cell wall biosynthesis n=2 Tax=Leeuwenhoekiella marinoflava TaxID=988 RepID=A0A4Q0PIT2_9FLAO|nr:glycosyltransferase [Leeuwenhoekiella marinoflava]RXG26918.1 glycosyltransferase involved in cell wall biosynthesis [Leeuwenhoekiella marinoflava]SHF41123.1 Glycosyltransferase involved in cell wall bisynthesis [Leeuwenhoekiella marinoflava DSM 3653]
MPKVSIILPTYNGQAYIEEAIASILNQTFIDFELIVVDDCSTDHTPKLLEFFRLQDSRIKIITNKHNLKLPASLNVGHRMAQGEYLTWTSDDNTLHSDFLERLVKVLETSGEDVVYSNFNVINDQSKHIRVYKVSPVILLPFENGIGASFLYRKEVFQKFNYNEDLHGIEDYDFWVRAANHFKFKHTSEVLYSYRVHKNSLTTEIGLNEVAQKKFEKNLKVVLSNFVMFRVDTQKILFQFQRQSHWDWDYFFSVRKEAELDFKKWIEFSELDMSMFKEYYIKVLRSLLINKAKRMQVLRLLFLNPSLISYKYSFRTSLNILKRIFI